MIKIAIIFCFYITQCLSQTYTYQTHLKTKLGSFQAGKNIIIVKNNSDDSTPRRTLTSQSTITNKFIKSFYSIQDSIHMNLNYDFSFITLYKSIQEKKKPLKIYNSKVMQDSIYYTKRIDSVLTQYNIATPQYPVYDAMGIIFSFQNTTNIKIHDAYHFNEHRKGKIRQVNLSIHSEELMQTPYGEIPCFVLSSTSPLEERKKGDIKIWISNDDKQIPIKIENKTKNGILTLLLESVE